MVKKFLRCLPSKYTAYKAAIYVSLNTDEIRFDEFVGMLRAHEMEIYGAKKEKGVHLYHKILARKKKMTMIQSVY